jgi:hypothetical protein
MRRLYTFGDLVAALGSYPRLIKRLIVEAGLEPVATASNRPLYGQRSLDRLRKLVAGTYRPRTGTAATAVAVVAAIAIAADADDAAPTDADADADAVADVPTDA